MTGETAGETESVTPQPGDFFDFCYRWAFDQVVARLANGEFIAPEVYLLRMRDNPTQPTISLVDIPSLGFPPGVQVANVLLTQFVRNFPAFDLAIFFHQAWWVERTVPIAQIEGQPPVDASLESDRTQVVEFRIATLTKLAIAACPLRLEDGVQRMQYAELVFPAMVLNASNEPSLVQTSARS